jgi:hypothetical protein
MGWSGRASAPLAYKLWGIEPRKEHVPCHGSSFSAAIATLGIDLGKNCFVTMGPASGNPATGQRYGLTFPIVSIHNFVEVQKAWSPAGGDRAIDGRALGLSMGRIVP